MRWHHEQVLFTAAQIADKTRELGQRVSVDYADKRPVIMPILKVGPFLREAKLRRGPGKGALPGGCPYRPWCLCYHLVPHGIPTDHALVTPWNVEGQGRKSSK